MLEDPSFAFVDDPTILDSEVLYRMVNAQTVRWQDGAAIRVQTNAFRDQSPQRAVSMGYRAVAVSVFLGSVMSENGIEPAHLIQDPRWQGGYGVASITAEQVRNEGQGIVRDPKPGSPAHGLVFTKSGPKKTMGQSKALARNSLLIIPPTGPPPGP